MNDMLNQEISQAILERQEELAQAVVAKIYRRERDKWAKYGEAGRDHSIRDMKYNLSYLAEAIAAGDEGLFVDYTGWAKTLFDGLGLPTDTMRTTLTVTREVLYESLPPTMHPRLDTYISAGLKEVSHILPPPATFITEDNPLADLAHQYLDRLLAGKRHEASDLILEAVRQGTSVKDIYLCIFQPTQHEIGRLWQLNQVTVAQEHYCTAATQLIMSQLYPHIFNHERNGRVLVATTVGGELHELGVRMVTDFFEMDGWDTYYLGANIPSKSILQTIHDRQADLLAISATITLHVSKTADLIKKLRRTNREIKILVGGYPFNLAPDLWQKVEADGYAANAAQAVQLANKLVNNT